MTFPFRHGGCAVAGRSGCGGRCVDGAIANLDLRQGDAQSVVGRFLHIHESIEGRLHRSPVYHNRQLAGEATVDRGYGSGPLAEGSHEFEVLLMRAPVAAAPDRIGDLVGRRV